MSLSSMNVGDLVAIGGVVVGALFFLSRMKNDTDSNSRAFQNLKQQLEDLNKQNSDLKLKLQAIRHESQMGQAKTEKNNLAERTYVKSRLEQHEFEIAELRKYLAELLQYQEKHTHFRVRGPRIIPMFTEHPTDVENLDIGD